MSIIFISLWRFFHLTEKAEAKIELKSSKFSFLHLSYTSFIISLPSLLYQLYHLYYTNIIWFPCLPCLYLHTFNFIFHNLKYSLFVHRRIYLGGKYTIQLTYSSNESHPSRFYDTPKFKGTLHTLGNGSCAFIPWWFLLYLIFSFPLVLALPWIIFSCACI